MQPNVTFSQILHNISEMKIDKKYFWKIAVIVGDRFDFYLSHCKMWLSTTKNDLA